VASWGIQFDPSRLRHLADRIAAREQAADPPISCRIGGGVYLTQIKLTIAIAVQKYCPAEKALIPLIQLVAGYAGCLV
jgi:hypothetical protein